MWTRASHRTPSIPRTPPAGALRTRSWIPAAAVVMTALAAGACDSGPEILAGPEAGSLETFVEAAARGPRAQSSELVPLPFFVHKVGGDPVDTGDSATPLVEAILGEPIVAPDGHQVTWGEWSGVAGRISVKCVESGTHAVLHLTGLIPRGVYTVWNVTFQPPGFTGEFDVPGSVPSNVIGFGPAGPSDGSRSEFRASASGRASISTITPAGALGSVGEIGGCALADEFEWHVVGLYHSDGQGYGPVRGPEGTRAEQFAFIFRN